MGEIIAGDKIQLSREELHNWAKENFADIYKKISAYESNLKATPSDKKAIRREIQRKLTRCNSDIRDAYKIIELKQWDRAIFEKDIDTIVNARSSRDFHKEQVFFGFTPAIYENIGFNQIPMFMRNVHIYTCANQDGFIKKIGLDEAHYHGLQSHGLKQIPDTIGKPVYIIQSLSNPESIVSLLEFTDKNGNPVLVAVKPFGHSALGDISIESNFITSAYGKNSYINFLNKCVDKHCILYADIKKSRRFPPTRPQWSDGMDSQSGFYNSNIQRYINFVNNNFALQGKHIHLSVNDSLSSIQPSKLWTPFENFQKHGILDVVGNTLNVDSTGRPTEKGWKDAATSLQIYSDKRYETARYLFLKNGTIIDHIAVSSKIPDATTIAPDKETLEDIRSYAETTDSMILFVHNHPSGFVRPSEADKHVTNIFSQQFIDNTGKNRFSGHVILDHGTMAIYDASKQTWGALIDNSIQSLDALIYSPDKSIDSVRVEGSLGLITLANYASKIDAKINWNTENWTPAFFTNRERIVQGIHYLSNNDFFSKSHRELSNILRQSAQLSGSEQVFIIMTKENRQLFNQIESFAASSKMIADVYHPTSTAYDISQYSGGVIFSGNEHITESIEDSRNYHSHIPQEEKMVDTQSLKKTNPYFYDGEFTEPMLNELQHMSSALDIDVDTSESLYRQWLGFYCFDTDSSENIYRYRYERRDDNSKFNNELDSFDMYAKMCIDGAQSSNFTITPVDYAKIFRYHYYQDSVNNKKLSMDEISEKLNYQKREVLISEPAASAIPTPAETGTSYHTGAELTQKQHKAFVQFLEKANSLNSDSQFLSFLNTYVQLPDFKFLKAVVPSMGRKNWPDYQKTLNTVYAKELSSYNSLYSEPIESTLETPLSSESEPGTGKISISDFLKQAQSLKTPDEYENFYNENYHYTAGSVQPVAPKKIALFRNDSELPLVIRDNSPENIVELYTLAIEKGIATTNTIPSPSDVREMGMYILNQSYDEHNQNLNIDYHKAEDRSFDEEENILAAAPEQSSNVPAPADTDFKSVFTNFIANPYKPGITVPTIGFRDEATGNIKILADYVFARKEDAEQTVIITKMNTEGTRLFIPISSTLYTAAIQNSSIITKALELTPDVIETYEKMAELDQEKARANTAVNFWHNYKALCRSQASNPVEAMDVARSIVKQMPKVEQTKFKKSVIEYKKLFVKPQESYDQRILNYYEKNVQDLPIKNVSVHGTDALFSIRNHVDVQERKGEPVDPRVRMKIGDTVKMSLDCKDLFGTQIKQLPSTELVVVSASTELNKIIVMDKDRQSKFTLDKNKFIQKIQKLEKKQQRLQKRLDKTETIGY